MMNRNRKKRDLFRSEGLWAVPLLILFLFLLSPVASAITVQMQPREISVGLGYNGSNLIVTGQSEPDEEMIIKITSSYSESRLKYIGKAGGIFWMKLGNMVFKPVPKAYVVFSSSPLEQLLPESVLSEYGLGYRALSENIEIGSDREEVDKDFWIGEFIKFKEHEQLYRINESAESRDVSGAEDRYHFNIEWPYQASPGEYHLEAFAVKGQRVVDQAAVDFQVKRSGMVSFLSSLAFDRAVLYGILAILVASLAGFSVGFIFKGGGAH